MANIKINNRAINYDGTIYQISQIVCAKPVRKKRKKPFELIPLTPSKNWPIKYLHQASWHPPLLIGVLLFMWLSGLFGIVIVALVGIFCLFSYIADYKTNKYNREIKNINTQREKASYYSIYGLSLKMSNGDTLLFIAPQEIVHIMNETVTKAINKKELVCVSFDNVTMEINESDDVNVGAVNTP